MQNLSTSHKYVNPGLMPDLKRKQLQRKNDDCKQLLGFMTEENIRFKNRLSEILKDRFDKNLLEVVDSFQNRFIRKDELIGLLRNDVTEIDNLLSREIFKTEKGSAEIDKRMKRLQNNMMTAESHFSKLRSEFNNFLSENIL